MARLDKITLRNWRESSLNAFAFQRDSTQILKQQKNGGYPNRCHLNKS
jgi:hypothetical protein